MKKEKTSGVKFIKLLQKGLPLAKRPFSSFAKYGITEEEAIKQMKKLKQEGKLRSLNVKVPDFRKIYKGSALVAWQVSLAKINKLGSAFAKIPEITHCYQRPELPDFPYNLYTMIHAKTKEQLKKFVEKLSKRLQIKSYVILYTLKEYKKEKSYKF